MSKGILYDFFTQTVEGNQTVPKGSHMADIQKLEGKTVVWNQLNRNFYPTGENNGLTFTNNGNGSWTVTRSGESIDTQAFRNLNYSAGVQNYTLNHKYYMFGGRDRARVQFIADSHVIATDSGEGIIFDYSGGYAVSWLRIQVLSASTFDGNETVYPQIIDLTTMFGTGKEPTLEYCKEFFNKVYYPYCLPVIKSVDNTKVIVGTVEYPLVFNGKSAGGLKDEIDFIEGKYIQRLGIVDLGSLNWSISANMFVTSLKEINATRTINHIISSPKYKDNGIAAGSDKSYFFGSLNVAFRDSDYSTVDDFKASIQGVMMCYELAEPVITDVSDIDSIKVEPNGTMVFDTEVPLTSTIEYLRYLNEV